MGSRSYTSTTAFSRFLGSFEQSFRSTVQLKTASSPSAASPPCPPSHINSGRCGSWHRSISEYYGQALRSFHSSRRARTSEAVYVVLI